MTTLEDFIESTKKKIESLTENVQRNLQIASDLQEEDFNQMKRTVENICMKNLGKVYPVVLKPSMLPRDDSYYQYMYLVYKEIEQEHASYLQQKLNAANDLRKEKNYCDTVLNALRGSDTAGNAMLTAHKEGEISKYEAMQSEVLKKIALLLGEENNED